MELGGQTIEIGLHPEVLLLCLGLLVVYWAAIRRYGPLFHPRPGDRSVTPRQVACFVAGVAALWIASGPPLHDIAEGYLFSAHMLQHLLQAFVVPPLILLGIPTWMGELALRPRWLREPVRTLGQPIVAAIVFNVVLLGIHWPSVVDLMVTDELFHGASHVVVLVVSFLMWLSVVSPAPTIVRPLSPVAKMFYLFTMTLLPTVPASFLVFGEEPLYRVYASFPRLWGLSAAEDMRIAGLIMKLGAGFLLWGVIAVMFFRWAAAEERLESGGSTPDGPPHPPVSRPRDGVTNR